MSLKNVKSLFVTFILLSFLFSEARAQKKVRVDTLKKVNLHAARISAGRHHSGAALYHAGIKEIINRPSKTLGQALEHVTGVQNTYFGPNAGLPMIRSMSGNRVRILNNGVGINDLSGLSPNLNLQFNTDNMSGLDVYKGDAAVLYGGRAIGGAINLRDNTIPIQPVKNKFEGSANIEAGNNSGSRQSLTIRSRLSKDWSLHVGGMNQSNGDLRIPGNTKAPIAFDPNMDALTESMAQVYLERKTVRNISIFPYISQFVLDNLNDPDWGLSEADLYTHKPTSYINGKTVPNPANKEYIPGQDPSTPATITKVIRIHDYAPVEKGIMPNSHASARSFNLGTGYISRSFRAGVGFKGAESYYGIPGFALYKMPEHSHAAESPKLTYLPINTRSITNTLMINAAWKPESILLNELRMNYIMDHGDNRELVGIYQANKFLAKRNAVRLETDQTYLAKIFGTTGLDISTNTIKSHGESRYLPNNRSDEIGVFSSQSLALKRLKIVLGYRHDYVQRRVINDETYKKNRGLAGGDLSTRKFNLNHFSSRADWLLFNFAYLRAAYTHAERAPDVNELYAGNNHFAIMVEENGDDRLSKERSDNIELALGVEHSGFSFLINAYNNTIKNYLYLAHTGISRSGGFLVKEWRGSDTRIGGVEAELGFEHSFSKQTAFKAKGYFDLVKNKNISEDEMRKWAEGDYMPNLPTSRFGINADFLISRIRSNIAFDRYMKQRYLGKNINPERPMPGYSLLSMRLSTERKIKGLMMEYFIYGNNLLNVDARPQNSFLKYIAPLPGRNISLGMRIKL